MNIIFKSKKNSAPSHLNEILMKYVKKQANLEKFQQLSFKSGSVKFHGNVTLQCQHIDPLPDFARTSGELRRKNHLSVAAHPPPTPKHIPTRPSDTSTNPRPTKFAKPYNNKWQK